jgi:hypothetical protein
MSNGDIVCCRGKHLCSSLLTFLDIGTVAVAILELGDSKLVSSREISSFSAILRSRDYLLDVGSNTFGRLREFNISNPYNNETLNF